MCRISDGIQNWPENGRMMVVERKKNPFIFKYRAKKKAIRKWKHKSKIAKCSLTVLHLIHIDLDFLFLFFMHLLTNLTAS